MYKIIVLLVLCLQEQVHCEPHCSRFHYEEKTLEKMIRLEIFVDKLRAEIEETSKRTSDMLDNLQKLKLQFSNELTDLQDEVRKELEKQITDVSNLKGKYHSTLWRLYYMRLKKSFLNTIFHLYK